MSRDPPGPRRRTCAERRTLANAATAVCQKIARPVTRRNTCAPAPAHDRAVRATILITIATLALSGAARAATYQVGPTRPHATLNALFNAIDLGPGDVVEVDRNVIYGGDIVMPAADGGAAGNPVTLRGIRVNGQRPHLRGGTNTIEFRLADHVVFEGFEVSGTYGGK